jgi:hypothetical protein
MLEEFSDEEVATIMDKAMKIKGKTKKKKHRMACEPLKNQMHEDFAKGRARNVICPMCNKKMKRCKC